MNALSASRSGWPPSRATFLLAHVRAPWLDRELAAGTASWRSRAHAARALQLTNDRGRRALARSLERLVEDAERRLPARSSVVPPCREQVREARPLILAIAARLRANTPVDASGVVLLRALLSDGTGPCYAPSHPETLLVALRNISPRLEALD